jgi:hypothetical protein
LIIINAITKDGWVPNAKLIYKSTKKTGDYHGQVNYEFNGTTLRHSNFVSL